jgi:hypothetical protein
VLLGFFARPRRGGALDISPGTIGLEATDVGSSWTVRISPDGIAANRGAGESDLFVRGSASDLYLFVWNRLQWDGRANEILELVGRQDLISSWRDHSHLTWS